ncbi:MAG: hypothetical protein QOD53_1194 [Thermoleophilaceae bacterium]|nr:hypothetical protein [Thermoleophilaceae bacterium]
MNGEDAAGQDPRGAAPSEEELRAAMEEQMRRITVDDVLIQTAVTLVNLGGRRLGLPGPDGDREEVPDLAQAKLAIDGVRALLPLLPAEPQAAIREAITQLQMAFAQLAQGGAEPAPGAQPPPAGGQPPEQPDQAADEAERAKARSKIWTPPGA